jgi:hypothetical protein
VLPPLLSRILPCCRVASPRCWIGQVEYRDYGGGVGISAGAGRGERSVTHCTGPLASSDFSCEGGIRLWVTYILYLRAILSLPFVYSLQSTYVVLM